jgi:hypothetical protein
MIRIIFLDDWSQSGSEGFIGMPRRLAVEQSHGFRVLASWKSLYR